VALDYKTKDENQYRILVVHIPNKFIGTINKEKKTHEAFKRYAEKELKSKITVTAYIGDMNYKKEMQEGSVPSMGGILSNNLTISPQSSGAKGETNFMQAISLSGPKEEGFRVTQPSTLNYVKINSNKKNKTNTDHPSIMCYTSHNSEIAGRNPESNPTYYE
jgi:hypothetical protein